MKKTNLALDEALKTAISSKNLRLVITAVEEGANVNATWEVEQKAHWESYDFLGGNHNTPLTLAIRLSTPEIAEYLIKQGAKLDKPADIRAASYDSGRDLSSNCWQNAQILPLAVAIKTEKPEMVTLLLKYGAKADIEDHILPKDVTPPNNGYAPRPLLLHAGEAFLHVDSDETAKQQRFLASFKALASYTDKLPLLAFGNKHKEHELLTRALLTALREQHAAGKNTSYAHAALNTLIEDALSEPPDRKTASHMREHYTQKYDYVAELIYTLQAIGGKISQKIKKEHKPHLAAAEASEDMAWKRYAELLHIILAEEIAHEKAVNAKAVEVLESTLATIGDDQEVMSKFRKMLASRWAATERRR